ncbi:MAG: Na/Pi cotransporter family protein [Bdellovibrionaceae bacterium]|nr:Na/Pi cotransporter family protein [Pseudobdellovibrionaceae bacterium]
MALPEHPSIVLLLAGISFLLYGLSRASEALQKLAANQIRNVLTRVSANGIVSLFVGMGLTLLMQSSAAVTATLVNLGTARVLSLPQVMGVLIGVAIGASLTVQLISLHMTDLGLPLFVAGFLVFYLSRRQRIRDSFEFVMSLGLLFFGIELIGVGAGGLVSAKFFTSAFVFLRENPFLAVAVSAVVTSVFHSSTATIGVVIALAAGGVVAPDDAIMWIYGANIGTASTGILAALRGDYVGKRIAWANVLYRVATVGIFVPFGPVAMALIQRYLESPSSQIAFFATAMNVFSASVFFPLRGYGVKVVEAIVQPGPSEREFGVRFLKRSNYESFSIALAHAKREILEMGDIVFQMLEASILMFRRQDPELVRDVRGSDDKVDLLLKEIKLFLIRVSETAPEGLSQSVIDLVSFGSDLEAAADVIDHHIASLAKKKHINQFEFSPEDWADLEDLHRNVVRALSLALSGFQTDDVKLAVQLVHLKHEIRDQENKFREAHIARLSKGVSVGIGTSAIYLECLGTYLQLVEMLTKHAQRVRNSQTPRPESSSTPAS